MKEHIFARALLYALLICAIAPLVGCDEDVTAVLGTDVPYTLYGVLSPQLDSQWVRVFPVEERLEPAVDEHLDARFESVDLTNGEHHVWRDSLVMDAFNQRAHVFWAPFQAEFGHSYRIMVERSDGAESTVEVTIPNETELVVQQPVVTATRVLSPILVEGDVPRLLRVEVIYAVGYVPVDGAGLESAFVSLPYDGVQKKVSDGWLVEVNLEEDFTAVVDTIQRRIERPVDRNAGVMLNNITLQLIVASEDWNPPGGVFNAEVLVQPGTLNNVENGFGYVVAGYRQETTWLPPDDVIEASRFRSAR